jgi:hypothetical protein
MSWKKFHLKEEPSHEVACMTLLYLRSLTRFLLLLNGLQNSPIHCPSHYPDLALTIFPSTSKLAMTFQDQTYSDLRTSSWNLRGSKILSKLHGIMLPV